MINLFKKQRFKRKAFIKLITFKAKKFNIMANLITLKAKKLDVKGAKKANKP